MQIYNKNCDYANITIPHPQKNDRNVSRKDIAADILR